MPPAGAAHADCEAELALLNVQRHKKAQQVFHLFHEGAGLDAVKNILGHRPVKAGEGTQLLQIVGVRQKAHVEDQIRVQRQPVLEAESLHRDLQRALGTGGRDKVKELALKLAEGEVGAVDDEIRPLADGGQQVHLPVDRFLDAAAALGQRVRPARLLIAAHDGGHIRVHVQDAAVAVHLLELVDGLQQLVKAVFGAHVRHQGNLFIAAARGNAELRKLRHQRHREIVHAVIIQILQHVRRAALPRAGEACDNQEIHILPLSLFPFCPPCRIAVGGPVSRRIAIDAAAVRTVSLLPPGADHCSPHTLCSGTWGPWSSSL